MWHSKKYVIKYEVKHINLKQPITKRHILSVVAQIYDPLGLLGPVILKAKVLLQKLCELKISWDDSLL